METLVLGASTNCDRYSYKAIVKLLAYNYSVKAIGGKEGVVMGVCIETGFPDFKGVHTVTVYLNAQRQKEYYDYIIGLCPERVLFNPGTENPEFFTLLEQKGIRYEMACTLVLLSTGQY